MKWEKVGLKFENHHYTHAKKRFAAWNMERERVVVLDGGLPWGFRIQGGRDTGLPLRIARVSNKSRRNNQMSSFCIIIHHCNHCRTVIESQPSIGAKENEYLRLWWRSDACLVIVTITKTINLIENIVFGALVLFYASTLTAGKIGRLTCYFSKF